MQKSILITLAIALCGFLPAQSQVTLQAGGGLGVIVPTADYGGTTIDYYNGKNYGLATGFNVHGKFRAGLLGFIVVGELGYSSLSNTGNSEPGKGTVEVSQKILTIKAGPEFQFNIPAAPITPYIGGNLAMNNFSGETLFNGVAEVPSGNYKIKSTARFGVGVNGGAIITINPLMKLDISIQYNLMNISGKKWIDVDASKDKRIESYEALNDEKDPLSNLNNTEHFISKTRTINSMVITASLMFGL